MSRRGIHCSAQLVCIDSDQGERWLVMLAFTTVDLRTMYRSVGGWE